MNKQSPLLSFRTSVLCVLCVVRLCEVSLSNHILGSVSGGFIFSLVGFILETGWWGLIQKKSKVDGNNSTGFHQNDVNPLWPAAARVSPTSLPLSPFLHVGQGMSEEDDWLSWPTTASHALLAWFGLWHRRMWNGYTAGIKSGGCCSGSLNSVSVLI